MHRHTCELSLAGRLLIWSWRHAVRAQRRRQDLPHFVLHTLTQLPQGDRIAESSESLFAHLLTGARRPLAMSCPDAHLLNNDEGSLIEALIAAGFGFEGDVRRILADLQHGGGLRRTTRAFLELARVLGELDLVVSSRTAPFTFPAPDKQSRTTNLRSSPRRV